MKISGAATSISWIPSDLVTGPMKLGFDVGLSHYDPPPPESVRLEDVQRLSDQDRFRFGNRLAAWAELDGSGAVTGCGYEESSGLVIGVSRIRLGPITVTVRSGRLPALRRDPVTLPDGGVRFVQTVGGRTGFPMPRPVSSAPYVQWSSPVVWTTLSLTLRPGGDHIVEMTGASRFPRHWVYGPDGELVGKSGVTEWSEWMSSSFGEHTPWGEGDSPAVVAKASSDLERALSNDIMRGARPQVRRLDAGADLVRQGEPGTELFLVLDGVLDVSVDGRVLGQVGPGAVLGERALLEGGVRTATVTASTPAVVAVAPEEDIDLERLAVLSQQHRREHDVS